jgi:hypothetical protein
MSRWVRAAGGEFPGHGVTRQTHLQPLTKSKKLSKMALEAPALGFSLLKAAEA